MGIKENIKILRKQHSLSQKDLAKIANVSANAVSSWEVGTKEPRMGAIQRIADHFGIKKSNLIEDDGMENLSEGYYHDPEVAELAEKLRTNPNGRILFDASRNLSKKDIEIVLNLIRGLKEKDGIVD